MLIYHIKLPNLNYFNKSPFFMCRPIFTIHAFNFTNGFSSFKGTASNDLGGRGNFRNEFIFSWEHLSYNLFSGKACQNLFFPRQGLSKFIFFLESTSQNLFFPGEYLSKFIFSWRRASKFLFSRLPPPPPQIITGRPLRLLL